jgi:uncharacterized protein (TIGR00290 family)
MALRELRRDPGVKVVALLTTVTEEYDRVSMHGARRELLLAQAEAVGLPTELVWIPKESTSGVYEQRMAHALLRWSAAGVREVAFGDLFLADVRKYREEKLAQVGMRALFPLWGRPTPELAAEFVRSGFAAVTTCVDSEQGLDQRFVGRELDSSFLADLPSGADPCGENGEYHSFVYDGPGFARKVAFTKGETVLRDKRFWYCDLLEGRGRTTVSGCFSRG